MSKPIPAALSALAIAVLASQISLAQAPATPPRPPAMTRPDPNSPANIGRTNLEHHLNSIAAASLAARAQTVAKINTRAEAEARQTLVRKQILTLLGPLPERTPLNAKVLGTTQAEGFRIEKILFDSQPGFHVTALLYIPDAKTGKLPAILMAPGHAPSGKAGDYATAAAFAHNGFVVLSYDPIGQGERLQYPDPAHPNQSLATRPTGEHGEAGLQPTLIGDAVAQYFLWDAIRAVDYLQTRPEVDPKRIGAFGCSGGGMMTALTAALEPRIAVTGVACFTTSFDTLLNTIGPQDGEQSIPHFIADGLDFPDWIELAAPRPYAAIATYSDMFPFAGARATVTEARRFYALFNPINAGTPPAEEKSSSFGEAGGPAKKSSVGETGAPAEKLSSFGEAGGPAVVPTAPALNIDTTNTIAPTAPLQFITGPGGHGALAPIMGNILSFFLRNLQPGADPDHPILPPPRKPGTNPFAPPPGLAPDALQVTSTGQVATSYPNAETIFSLNQKRAAKITTPHLTGEKLIAAIHEVTGSVTKPNAPSHKPTPESLTAKSGPFTLPSSAGLDLHGDLFVPTTPGRHPAVILLVPDSIDSSSPIARANKTQFDTLTAANNVVLAITPRPSPPGSEEMKSPILGPFYLLSLRAELNSRTMIGMRTDDVIRTLDYLAARPDVDPAKITAIGSGHMGLVLLHAALVDPRLQHITIDHTLASYRSLIEAPLPTGAPEDIIPGVLLHYDIPELTRALGPRLTQTNPLPGTADLSQTSTPLPTLTKPTP